MSFHLLQLRNTQSYCTDNECLTDRKYYLYFIHKEFCHLTLNEIPFKFIHQVMCEFLDQAHKIFLLIDFNYCKAQIDVTFH